MSIKADELAKIAVLARLKVDPEHLQSLTQDLDQILHFVEQMNQQNTQSIEPLGNPLEQHQRLRTDCVTEPNQREALQSVCNTTEKGLYLVPKVIE
ncbi:MAG: Asp-tRNA(Asn)/Glu-tRNA(Gln) amidotransferase subunit GatC [Hahellaceae bacterium]|nr:Asp-tRNA(Asn)/Glu-tRNA(Gln) amidotransferase subunit GatC [Hahellaceae bacterium]